MGEMKGGSTRRGVAQHGRALRLGRRGFVGPNPTTPTKLLGTEVKIKEKRWLGKKRRWSEFGIIYIRVSDWQLYIKIITWISLWRSEILNSKVSFDAYESIAKSGFFSTIEWI